MGTYYQYTNYTKKEEISLSSIANIKQSAFVRYSIQIAILNTFLGFGRFQSPYVGIWKKDSIALENDSIGNESDDWEYDAADRRDKGMEFLAYLHLKHILVDWLKEMNLDDWVKTDLSYMQKKLDQWIFQNNFALTTINQNAIPRI